MANLTRAQSETGSLEISSEERRRLTDKITKFVEDHLERVERRQAPCFYRKADGTSGQGLRNCSFDEQPKDIDTLLQIYKNDVVCNGHDLSHGGHLGAVPSGSGVYPAALGDYLAASINRSAMCPGAVHLEHLLTSWVAGLFDFPAGFAGTLTSGGSMSTVLSFLTARHSRQLKGRDFERTVIYTTEATHACVYKTLNVIGLSEAIVRKVPMDDEFRMIPSELRSMVRHDQQAGLLPSIVTVTTGTTNFGSVDPVDEIADITEEFDLWLHVDAAYGGFFVLVEELRHLFKGVRRADSVIVDPHKSLFLPLGLGIVIIREGHKLSAANTTHDKMSYIHDVINVCDEESPINLSFELTRHFRSVRMWLPLQLYGVKAFRENLKEKIDLARHFASRISDLPGFVVDNYPQLSIVTFHYETRSDDTNERANQELLDRILKDGSVFLTSTRIRGRFRLRVCVLHFRCHKHVIDFLVSFLEDNAKTLKFQA